MRKLSTLSDLTPDPGNLRRHSPRGLALLTQALREVGAARSVVADEDGTVLAGNLTVQAAQQAGIAKVKVVEADGSELVVVRRTGLSPEAKVKLALFDNRVPELSDFDPALLAGLQQQDFDLSPFWTDEELSALLAGAGQSTGTPAEDPGPQLDKAEELREHYGVQPGQLWQLGEHRVLCGDATKREDVERVLSGQRADMLL